MALFTERQIRDRYLKEKNSRRKTTGYFSAETVLSEGRITNSTKQYDIFLSHSTKDEELIAGLKLMLEDLGYTVYVDWNDCALDPNNVTPETAKILRERMAQCKSLIYAFSENASNSKWMPWELGFFDALKNSRVAVLPISQTSKYAYKGSEYVGVYNVVQIAKIRDTTQNAIWIYDDDNYVIFDKWLKGSNPFKHSL